VSAPPPLAVLDLGRRPYPEVWALQRELVDARLAGTRPDTLVLCEHDHVITVGRTKDARQHLVAPGDVPVVEIERGGDVTYHGPGQLVGYPIVLLGEGERDLHRLLRSLEEALIVALERACGVAAGRRAGLTGVWVGARKIASIGVAVRRWVTYHGFALNLQPDLAYFGRIHPCGLDPEVMTSVAALGHPVDEARVKAEVARGLAEALGRTL
jgi:lipoyl(octanoyl) transferase